MDDINSRLRKAWRTSKVSQTKFPNPTSQGYQNPTLYCEPFRWEATGARIEEDVRQKYLQKLAEDLITSACHSHDHFELVDNKFSTLVSCNFETSEPEHTILDQALRILHRLPKTPPEINFEHALWQAPSIDSWPEEYFTDTARADFPPIKNQERARRPWEAFKVVSNSGTTVLWQAFAIVTAARGDSRASSSMHILIETTSDLIDLVSRASSHGSASRLYGKYITLAYLWTSWQRSMMLLFHFMIKQQPVYVIDDEWSDRLALRSNSLLSHPSMRATLHGWADLRSPYMCSWAFSMLLENRPCLALDFRRFHQRFAAAYPNRPARCLYDSDTACDGSHPMACGRFVDKRLVAEEQTLHDYTCTGHCEKLVWNELSYRSITGPRAVSVSSQHRIDYCQASHLTMSVTHVWSHGQGGRPDTGINYCLHERYVKLARKNGCDSYWIDTVCIPNAHDLRKEAISYINSTFTNSKIVLVCDRDLASFEGGQVWESIESLEALLVTLLVCDWSVRAWTLLEGVRGNHALYLLCRQNNLVPLRKALSDLYSRGSIDIIILFHTVNHLFSSSLDGFRKPSTRKSIECAGHLLSHRHATRSGDDIVIWSLLSTTQVFFEAEALWKSKIKSRVKTGYLMTSTQRLSSIPGFSWAPSSPYVRQPELSSVSPPSTSHFFAFDGDGSEEGIVTKQGLLAVWLVYELNENHAQLYQDAPVTATFLQSDGTEVYQVLPGHRVWNTCWREATQCLDRYRYVNLLRSKSDRSVEPYQAAQSGREVRGPALAVCGSHDGERWKWEGVYEWNRTIPLPPFAPDEILLI